MDATLEELIERTIARPVPPAIQAMADHVRRTCGLNVQAMLAYGSCLRDAEPTESLIDLYVLTAEPSGLGTLSALGCRLVPPNVYYAEVRYEGSVLRSKYAVLSLPQFATRMRVSNPYFWARFAQPTALILAKDRQAIIAALAQAVSTMFAHAKGCASSLSPREIWAAGFRATYATEFRSEGPDRAEQLVAANSDYYKNIASLLASMPAKNVSWPRLRLIGKVLSLLRLVKAAFTFAGAADYLAWKIERHSGKAIALSDWQRRHPILAGVVLLPKLLRSGAVK